MSGVADVSLVDNHALIGNIEIDTEGSRETTNQNSYAEGFDKNKVVANLMVVKKHIQNKSIPLQSNGFKGIKTFDPRQEGMDMKKVSRLDSFQELKDF